MGVTQPVISAWESGRAVPPLPMQQKLSAFLGHAIPWLREVTEDEYRLSWSTAYWEARDRGCSSLHALRHADTVTEQMLDALEER